jgi:hypothetical protein
VIQQKAWMEGVVEEKLFQSLYPFQSQYQYQYQYRCRFLFRY